MPGGRLTQQERQQIALGLADSLPYAEIARRLDRPTSTITREVMRNDGPTAYRADLAHRATERRAHRRKHTPPRGQGAPAQGRGRDDEAVREYEEAFTTLLMQQGMPKMTARVLTCLFTADAGSLTASELAQHLQVSPASVSKAIAFLERPGPHPPGTRRTPPRALPRRRRRLVPVDDRQRPRRCPGRRDRTAGRRRPRPRDTGRRPPGEHRPLQRLHQREHAPRRGAGPRGPLHETRNAPR